MLWDQDGNPALTEEQLRGTACLNCNQPVNKRGVAGFKMHCCNYCRKLYYMNVPPEQRVVIRQQQYDARRISYTCNCCGKAFVDYPGRTRKYCSKECQGAARSYTGSDKQVAVDEIEVLHGRMERQRAFELLAAGVSVKEIAQATNCNRGTLYGRIRAAKKQQGDYQQALNAIEGHAEPYFRFAPARNIAEWLAVLDDEMRCSQWATDNHCPERTVTLVCATTSLRRNLYAYVEIVESELGLAAQNSGIYAFCCNVERDHLLYFQWDGSGFQLTRRQRDRGRYVWPGEKLGKYVAVTPAEFEFILYGSRGKKSIKKP